MKFLQHRALRFRGSSSAWALASLLSMAMACGALAGNSRGREAKAGAGGAGGAAHTSAAAERSTPAGDVVVVLNEGFLNALLEAILSQASPPKFPLSKGGAKDCASEIILAREAQGARTAVSFKDGRITAPVAFRGSYAAPLVGCFKFEGWAETVFNLAFDAERQAFTARIEVRQVNLNKIPSLLGGGITELVQDAIDRRVNPVEILRADQLAARIPVTQDNALRLRAREIQHEVAGKELRLRIVYEIVRND